MQCSTLNPQPSVLSPPLSTPSQCHLVSLIEERDEKEAGDEDELDARESDRDDAASPQSNIVASSRYLAAHTSNDGARRFRDQA